MTILCYHSVDPEWDSPLAVTPAAFARQAAWLRAHRRVLPLAEALPRLDATGRLPRGRAVLTFDDGFADNHTHVLPVLRREGLPGTVFLVAQTLTPGGRPVDWVRTPGAGALRTLTVDQVLEMQDAGVDFQSHSWAHRDLVDLTYAECLRDLTDSREFLSELLGRPVTVLAYPRGLHDGKVRAAAEAAGYAYALSLPERAEEVGPYAVPRVGIHRGNGPLTLRVKSSRSYLRLRHSERLARSRHRVRRIAARVEAAAGR